MAVIETPRFQRYKARKRDNWTVQRLANKIYGVRIGWPSIGLTFIAIVALKSLFGWEMPGGWSNFDLALFGVLLIWLPLWVIAMTDKGRGFGVFIGWLMFFVGGSKVREEFRLQAERELLKTDEELFDTYVRTRPESSR